MTKEVVNILLTCCSYHTFLKQWPCVAASTTFSAKLGSCKIVVSFAHFFKLLLDILITPLILFTPLKLGHIIQVLRICYLLALNFGAWSLLTLDFVLNVLLDIRNSVVNLLECLVKLGLDLVV